MSEGQIKHILIAGGGTAGWLSAAYLNRALGKNVKVTLVASEEIGRIGVGEATIPTMRNTMNFLGFQEEEWMPRCNATYKMALRFVNWKYAPGTVENDAYYHPFSHERETISHVFNAPFFPFIGEGVSSSYLWHKNRIDGDTTSFVHKTHIEPHLCDQKLSPRVVNGKPQITSYAYHFDASKLAQYLMLKSVERGVNFHDDKIIGVNKHENGHIKSILTEKSGEMEADFFIDCTGMRALLIGDALNVPFEDYASSLFMNSAVAVHRHNNPEQDGILPYSNITALSAGWSWDIPLFDRNGTGYVYSDNFITPDKAETELRNLMGEKSADFTAKHLKFKVGKYKDVWSKNCLAIGLSGSFLEPLESTSIFFSEFQLGLFLNHFPDKSCNPSVANHFNDIFTEKFEEVRDFLIMHYVLSNREDTAFWKSVMHETIIPESLQERLNFFKQQLPSMNGLKLSIFPPKSYTCILDGMGHIPNHKYPLLANLDLERARKEQMEFEKLRDEIITQQPDHYEWLKQMYVSENV